LEDLNFRITLASDSSVQSQLPDDNEILSLLRRLKIAQQEKRRLRHLRRKVAERAHSKLLLRDQTEFLWNRLQLEYSSITELNQSMAREVKRQKEFLTKLKQTNVLNDVFYIWHAGPFGTINNFRLGRMVSYPVDWTEINAAFGQICLAITTITSITNFQFRKYEICPMGSYSKIHKIYDVKIVYHLFADSNYSPSAYSSLLSNFPKNNSLNMAIMALLECMQELGDYIKVIDPTLQLPYVIDTLNHTIHEPTLSLLLNNTYSANTSDDNYDGNWTKALKFLLADLKFMIAWTAKHYGNHLRKLPEDVLDPA